MSPVGRFLFALAAIVLASGCGDPELREWTPDDHQQPAQPDPSRTPVDQTPQQSIAAAAAALFGTSCAGCHGVDGTGGGPSAPPGAQMPDLGAPSLQEQRTDAQLSQVIADGRGMMPGFGTQLNERGIAALVAHIRTLRRPEE